MTHIALYVLFLVISLFSLMFIASRYRKATALQRRQIIFGCLGALVIAAGLLCLIAFK